MSAHDPRRARREAARPRRAGGQLRGVLRAARRVRRRRARRGATPTVRSRAWPPISRAAPPAARTTRACATSSPARVDCARRAGEGSGRTPTRGSPCPPRRPPPRSTRGSWRTSRIAGWVRGTDTRPTRSRACAPRTSSSRTRPSGPCTVATPSPTWVRACDRALPRLSLRGAGAGLPRDRPAEGDRAVADARDQHRADRAATGSAPTAARPKFPHRGRRPTEWLPGRPRVPLPRRL